MKRKDKAYSLIVGESPMNDVLGRALGGASPVRLCEGAAHVDCPAARGKRCALRDNARIAVIFVGADAATSDNVVCVPASDGPAVSVILGTALEPYAANGFAAVGGGSGPVGVLEAIAAVLEGP